MNRNKLYKTVVGQYLTIISTLFIFFYITVKFSSMWISGGYLVGIFILYKVLEFVSGIKLYYTEQPQPILTESGIMYTKVCRSWSGLTIEKDKYYVALFKPKTFFWKRISRSADIDAEKLMDVPSIEENIGKLVIERSKHLSEIEEQKSKNRKVKESFKNWNKISGNKEFLRDQKLKRLIEEDNDKKK